MRKAIIAGNHLITPESLTLENAAIEHAKKILTPDTDLILYFDQIDVKTLDVIDTDKSLPLAKIKNFARSAELPELSEEIVRIIFENTLRNYSDGVYKKKKPSALHRNMFVESDERVKCTCVGLLISLIEILQKRYETVVFVVQKQSERVRPNDILKVKTVLPTLELVWI